MISRENGPMRMKIQGIDLIDYFVNFFMTTDVQTAITHYTVHHFQAYDITRNI